MAVTCDGWRHSGDAVAVGTTTLQATLRGRTLTMDLCDPCAQRLEADLIKEGAKVLGASVDYKPRAAYVAASGVSFTAEEARPWLIGQGLAGPRGRLSKTQLKAYADAH